MAKVHQSILRGLLIPDARLTLDLSTSGVYDAGGTRIAALPQAGPRPGEADASLAQGSATLLPSGSPTTTSALEVSTVRGGYPGDAELLWRIEGEAAWLGWDGPYALSGWEPIFWSASVLTRCAHPHAVALEDGSVVVVADRGSGAVAVWVRSVAGAWSSIGPILTGLGGHGWPTILVVDGRLWVYAWSQQGGAAQLLSAYSDDGGLTWSTGPAALLEESLPTATHTPKRLRAAHADGQWVLLAWTASTASTGDALWQWRSTDGLRFTLVDADSYGASGGAWPDLVAIEGGGFAALWLDSASGHVYCAPLSTAGQWLRDLTPVDVTTSAGLSSGWGQQAGGLWADGDVVLWRDGPRLYATGRQTDSYHEWPVIVSTDQGATWAAASRSSGFAPVGVWWSPFDLSYPRDACAVACQGQALVIHCVQPTTSTYDEGLACAILGGWSTVVLPEVTGWSYPSAWEWTWAPYDLPGDCGWTRTATGSPSESVTSGLLAVACAAGESLRWHTTDASGTSQAAVTATVAVTSGVAVVEARTSATSTGREVRVEITASNCRAYDAVSGAQIGSTVALSGEVQVLVAIEGAEAAVWVAPYTPAARRWQLVAHTTSLSDSGGGSTGRARFGHGPTVTAQAATWRCWGTHWGSTSPALASAPASPSIGHPTGSEQAWLGEGVSASLVGGVAWPGDVWRIQPDWEWAAAHLSPLIEPSPALGWRSTPVSEFPAGHAEVRITFKINEINQDEDTLVDLVAAYLDGINCRDVTLELSEGGTWEPVATLEPWKIDALRKGGTVYPSSTPAAGRQVRLGELAGAGCQLDTDVRTIRQSWPGSTASGTSTLRARLEIDGITGAESTSPLVYVWPRRAVVGVHMTAGWSRAISGWRLRIPTDVVPASGYLEIGTFALGPVAVFGLPYGWGRETGITSGVELATRRDGSRRADHLSSPRRSVTLAWEEGIDQLGLTLADPGWVSAHDDGQPVAWRVGSAQLLQDLVLTLDGPSTPVVYLPGLDYQDADVTQVLTEGRAGGALYGRLVSPIRATGVLGVEEQDEVVRIVGVTLEEEL